LDTFYKKDSSHGWNHIEDVAKNALEINRRMILNLNEEYLVLAALFHDIYSDTNRKNHHTLAADWFAKFMIKQYKYDAIDILEMSSAIKEHRASYKGEYSSLLSEVLAAADRGAPDLNSKIIRSSKYYLEREPNSDLKTIAENVYKHMVEKFSRTGYMKYNAIYSSFYKKEIHNMYVTIDKLSVDKVFNILIENLKE
jgi:HD superfamily phosphodiesterase